MSPVSPKLTHAIEESASLTVQTTPKDEVIGGNFALLRLLSSGASLAPGWWSPSRDVWLRNFFKLSDHLSGAIYTMQSKMTAIPIRVVPHDMNDKAAVLEANIMTDLLNNSPGFGKGWISEYGKFVEDLITQDNGAFLEVIGAGPKSGPVIGMPISISHLDSARCQRTGNATYPVIYTDRNGLKYKLHYTRIMFESQMPSPSEEMLGVGFSAVSRCIGIAQNLIDIVTYKQEKLGSRPKRELVVAKGGLDPRDIATALTKADLAMDAKGLTRYSQIVIVGSQTIPEADVSIIGLSEMPDGFDEQTSTTLGMATIALALGMDARELFPALTSGATRADALLQHLKQRGKGPGQILQITEGLLNFKFLPPHLKAVTDFQDDEQDRQTAEIRAVRANRRVQDTTTGVIDERRTREIMVLDHDITQEQFEQLELESGRLADGSPITSLFFRKSEKYRKYLDLGVDNPLDYAQNNPEDILAAITDKRAEIYEVFANPASTIDKIIARECDRALTEIELQYMDLQKQEEELQQQEEEFQQQLALQQQRSSGAPSSNNSKPAAKPTNQQTLGMVGRPAKPGTKRLPGKKYIDPRIRSGGLMGQVSSSKITEQGNP